MLVIVASHHDEQARELADRWASWNAAVLTCEDLSAAGWRHVPGSPEDSVAIIGDQAVSSGTIEGVLTRLPYVPDHELLQIVREDRAYVAAEMTAFLRSWLSGLECPILNRPTASCLSGPGWSREQAVHVAARLSIPVRPVELWSRPGEESVEEALDPLPGTTVTVVGHRCIGAETPTLAHHALQLAKVAEVELLVVRFEEVEVQRVLRDADPWADTSDPEVADAILDYFLERQPC